MASSSIHIRCEWLSKLGKLDFNMIIFVCHIGSQDLGEDLRIPIITASFTWRKVQTMKPGETSLRSLKQL